MSTPTVNYHPEDIALAAFNKFMASPDCRTIIGYLYQRQDWTEENQLANLSDLPEMVIKNLKSLTAGNVLNCTERDGATLYRLDPHYFQRISLQFNKLVDEMANGHTNNKL